MATTVYLINLRLEFDSKTARNTQFAALKTQLANMKTTDAWVSGKISKDEYQVAESATDAV